MDNWANSWAYACEKSRLEKKYAFTRSKPNGFGWIPVVR